ncbi:hypothetical protein [Methylobacterium sp. JK268]
MKRSLRGIGWRLALASAAGLVLPTASALAAPLALPLPPPLPALRVMTLLTGLHLLGLCLGFGGAAMTDFWILRWMRWGGMPREIERMVRFFAKAVTVGLALLWLSGLGFLAVYTIEAPEKLANPKIWAKVTVVVVLTLNGLLIHALVLPKVLRDVRRPILDGLAPGVAAAFLLSGAVSGASWMFAFALGILREFNGVVAAPLLLGAWVAAIAAACCSTTILWWRWRRTGILRRAAILPPLETDRPFVGIRRLLWGSEREAEGAPEQDRGAVV